jgi:hypothetical protein
MARPGGNQLAYCAMQQRRAHLKVVWVAFVAEDVHKQRPSRLQPGADAAQQLLQQQQW